MEIAITGIDCRFPGAPTKEAFWELLLEGGDGVSSVPDERWDRDSFHAADLVPGHTNTREGGFIADPDAFDNEFFGITPAEAAAMDPQQRMLLESAWRAIEDSGIAPPVLQRSRTGVYVGVMGNEWAHVQLADYNAITPFVGAGNGYCMIANRVSYHLDLRGPSLAIDTACSSSLVAVHHACGGLRGGDCDRAIAAGVNLIVTPALHIFYAQAGLSAPDGRCKPYSADAGGIGRAEGIGAVVLRRLEDALADGDRIYAVIRGGAINHDGRSNGLTAPSRRAQVDVIRRAHDAAAVDAAGVAFVEGHGTGTVLGDMIEVKALGEAYGPRRERPLAVGSVKGNIGHAEGAAGIAALIKVALALHHGLLPPTRYASRENHQLALSRHGLELASEPVALGSGRVCAGISSFGLGGTNAHLMLATAPCRETGVSQRGAPAATDADTCVAPGVFTLSGSDVAAVQRNAAASARAIRDSGDVSLAGLCQASNRIKVSLRHRAAVGAGSPDELASVLEALATDDAVAARQVRRRERAPRIAFAFTGQGSQHPGMTRALLECSPVYRRHLADADAALAPHLGRSIAEAMLSGDAEIGDTRLAQPAIFAVGCALARTLAELGIEPRVVVGHSVGEFAAAVTAGALALGDAAGLVAARGRLMGGLPAGGGMLSVRAAVTEIEPLLNGRASVAAVNGPRSVVVAGAIDQLSKLGDELTLRGVAVARLDVSHAFHSPLMEPILDEFRLHAMQVYGARARIPIVSTSTAETIDGGALDGDYWTRQIRLPVRFADAIATVARADVSHVVELGPRPVLTSLIRGIPAADGLVCLSATSSPSSGADLARLLAALYADGADPRWDALYEDELPPSPLPPYEFSRSNRFWSVARRAASASEHHHQREEKRPEQEHRDVSERSGHRSGRDDDAPATSAYQLVVSALCHVSGHDESRIDRTSRLSEDLGLDSVTIMSVKRELELSWPAVASLDVRQLLAHLASVGSLTAHLEDALGVPTANR